MRLYIIGVGSSDRAKIAWRWRIWTSHRSCTLYELTALTQRFEDCVLAICCNGPVFPGALPCHEPASSILADHLEMGFSISYLVVLEEGKKIA